jgi:hypothetical protein
VPKPPCPSLFEYEKLSVAVTIVDRSMKDSSSALTNSPSCVMATPVWLVSSCISAFWLFSSSANKHEITSLLIILGKKKKKKKRKDFDGN